MKRLAYISGVVAIALFTASCFEKIDNWYTNTSSYDGRYAVGIECEEDDGYAVDVKYGYELWISNSAANISDEIIIDTHVGVIVSTEMDGDFEVSAIEDEGYAVRGKFKITGAPLDFWGVSESSNLYYENMRVSDANGFLFYYDDEYYSLSEYGNPEDLDEEAEGIQLYSRISLDGGNIIPNGATTIGRNTSDAIEIKLTTYCELLVYEAYEIPEANWTVPGVPEYRWRIKEGSRKNADGWEEHWTLKGYRYTGYPEDIGASPPVIEK